MGEGDASEVQYELVPVSAQALIGVCYLLPKQGTDPQRPRESQQFHGTTDNPLHRKTQGAGLKGPCLRQPKIHNDTKTPGFYDGSNGRHASDR
jgi:hypothetical protein